MISTSYFVPQTIRYNMCCCTTAAVPPCTEWQYTSSIQALGVEASVSVEATRFSPDLEYLLLPCLAVSAFGVWYDGSRGTLCPLSLHPPVSLHTTAVAFFPPNSQLLPRFHGGGPPRPASFSLSLCMLCFLTAVLYTRYFVLRNTQSCSTNCSPDGQCR